MKDVIISEKARKEEILSESIANMTAPAEMAQVLSLIDFAGRYNWVMSDVDLDIAKELGLTGIKKYWRYIGQVEMELNGLYDWIPALATLVGHSHRVYNNEEVGQNISVRQNIDPEWVSSFFVQLHGSI